MMCETARGLSVDACASSFQNPVPEGSSTFSHRYPPNSHQELLNIKLYKRSDKHRPLKSSSHIVLNFYVYLRRFKEGGGVLNTPRLATSILILIKAAPYHFIFRYLRSKYAMLTPI